MSTKPRDMEPGQLCNFNHQGDCFNMLARLFDRPLAGIHNNMEQYGVLVKPAGILKPKAFELLKKLRKTTETMIIEELSAEYASLFTGHETAPASPSCDAYLSKQRNKSDLLKEVQEFYTKAGFPFQQYSQNPGHITAELRFIGHLYYTMAFEYNRGNLAQVEYLSILRCRFIDEHMILWIPEFTRCILLKSKSPFYLQLAILLRTLLVNCTGEEDSLTD